MFGLITTIATLVVSMAIMLFVGFALSGAIRGAWKGDKLNIGAIKDEATLKTQETFKRLAKTFKSKPIEDVAEPPEPKTA